MSVFEFLTAPITSKSWTNATLETQVTHEVTFVGVKAATPAAWEWRPISCSSSRQQLLNVIRTLSLEYYVLNSRNSSHTRQKKSWFYFNNTCDPITYKTKYTIVLEMTTYMEETWHICLISMLQKHKHFLQLTKLKNV